VRDLLFRLRLAHTHESFRSAYHRRLKEEAEAVELAKHNAYQWGLAERHHRTATRYKVLVAWREYLRANAVMRARVKKFAQLRVVGLWRRWTVTHRAERGQYLIAATFAIAHRSQRAMERWKVYTAVERAKGATADDRVERFWRYGALQRCLDALVEHAGMSKAARYHKLRVLRSVMAAWGGISSNTKVARMEVTEQRMVELPDGTLVDASTLQQRLEAEAAARAEAEAIAAHAAAAAAFQREAAAEAERAMWEGARVEAARRVRSTRILSAQAVARRQRVVQEGKLAHIRFDVEWHSRVRRACRVMHVHFRTCTGASCTHRPAPSPPRRSQPPWRQRRRRSTNGPREPPRATP